MELIELLEEKDDFFVKAENGLLVYNNVDLSYSKLKEFPNYPMVFLGDVDISYTPIKEFPDCPIEFYGFLNISHTPIKELPECTIKDYLDIEGTSITEIPKKLKADCIYTPVKGKCPIIIRKNGKIGINGLEKSIAKWNKFFEKKLPFDDILFFPINLTPEEYDIVEQDYKTAVKLLESWRS